MLDSPPMCSVDGVRDDVRRPVLEGRVLLNVILTGYSILCHIGPRARLRLTDEDWKSRRAKRDLWDCGLRKLEQEPLETRSERRECT